MKLSKLIVRAAYVVFGIVYLAGCNSGGGSSTTTSFGNVQIAFLGTITTTDGVVIKNALLNVSNVLLNPTAGAMTATPGWQTVPVPTNFPLGSPAGAFQMDLNNIGVLPVVYNTGLIPTATYQTLQIQLDSLPGAIVPLCPGSGLEGCIVYPIQFSSAPSLIIPLSPTVPVSPSLNPLPTILVQFNMTIESLPTTTGGPFMVDLQTKVLPSPPDSNEAIFSGTVAGNVAGAPQVTNQIVSAEIAGTNTFVTSEEIANNAFQLNLPASPAGTLYDLVISGGSSTFGAIRLPTLPPGAAPSQAFTVAGGQTIGAMSGQVRDACTGVGIPNATVQLLVPPQGSGQPPSFCANPATAGGCISVASTPTDDIPPNVGNYPALNAAGGVTGQFASIPVLAFNADKSGPYAIKVSAPGYDTLYFRGDSGSSTTPPVGNCGVIGSPAVCDFSLTRALMGGTVTLTAAPAPEQNVNVIVFAEVSETNDIVAMSDPLTFVYPNQSQTFQMFTPSNAPYPNTNPPVPVIPKLDFFAVATDTYKGATDPYTGHSIFVVPQVTTVDSCSLTASQINFDAATPPNPVPMTLDCTGHGGVTGTLDDANNLTSVFLSATGTIPGTTSTAPVLLMSAGVGSDGQTYAICAPGNTVDNPNYNLQRYQVTNPPPPTPTPTPTPVTGPTPTPTVVPTPTPMATGSVADLTIPTPAPTGTGCPTTCNNPDGTTCPGPCATGTPSIDPL